MRIEISPEQAKYENGGISVCVRGFRHDPNTGPEEGEQVYIEVYEGKLRVHIWDGSSEDPITTAIEPVVAAEARWQRR